MKSAFQWGAMAILFFFGACHKEGGGRQLGYVFSQMSKPEVWRVPSNTQAQMIGLKPGDVIISYNDEIVRTITEFFQAESLGKEKGGRVKIVVLRDNQEVTLEARAEPLGFIPVYQSYSGSLAKSLEDIMSYFGQIGYYDWLNALTGESFIFSLRDTDPTSWGVGGEVSRYMEAIGKLTGLSFNLLWKSSGMDSLEEKRRFLLVKDALDANRVLLVKGGWGSYHPYLWGVITHYNPSDSTLYGYSLDKGEEMPLTGRVLEIYEVKCQKRLAPDPHQFLTTVLDQVLEWSLVSSDTGWHYGLEAYDIMMKELYQFPSPPDTDFATDCFYRLLWRLIAGKESAIRFFEDMKKAFPQLAGLFDEVIGRHRAILGRLEGSAIARLPLTTPENREKLIRVLGEIQEIENDLLGIYEEIISEL